MFCKCCFVQIHWFSIFNSFMMVIFLTGLVSMILMRTLRNDYAKYAREDDDLETLVTHFSSRILMYFVICLYSYVTYTPMLTQLLSSGTGCQ